MKKKIMKKFALLLFACVCAITASARNLQTIYSVGNYRIKNASEFGAAVKKRVSEEPVIEKAWRSIVARADAAFDVKKPKIQPLAVEIKLARKNNESNIKIARAIYDSTIAWCGTRDSKYQETAINYFDAFVKKFKPEEQIDDIELTHKYHLLYARDWLPYLARSYDLLFNSLSDKKKKKFGVWLKAMVEVINEKDVWAKWRNTTHGAWQTAAIEIVGKATEDANLLVSARRRILYQLENVIGPDGLWPGGSLALNYTATRAFLAYAEVNLPGKGRAYRWKNKFKESYLHNLINAPLMFIDALGAIPGSDNMKTELPPGDIYLVAYLRYRDDLYGEIMERQIDKIDDEKILVYYWKPKRKVNIFPRPLYSVVSPSMGWGILRKFANKPAKSLYARLDYGPHGSSGGNADKLDLYFCGLGRRVVSSGGSYAVDSPLRFGWTKQTLAHNTVVLNYQSQLGAETPSDPNGVPGKLLLFDRNDDINVVEADAQKSYPKAPLTSYRRCIAMPDDYILDIFTIISSKPIAADWVIHGLGKQVVINNAVKGECALNNKLARAGLLGSKTDGYNWIDNVQSYKANEQWSVIWSSGLRTIMMGQPGTRLLLGESGGDARIIGDDHVADRTYSEHTLIARRINTLDTRFIALHEILTTNQPKIKSFARLEAGTDALILEIITDEYKDIFILQPKRIAKEMMIDERHLVSMNPRRYGYCRIDLKTGKAIKQVNLTVNEVE